MKAHWYSLIFLFANSSLIFCVSDEFLFVDFDTSMEWGSNNPYARKVNRQPLKEAQECMIFLKDLYNHNVQLKPKKTALIPKIFHQIWLGPLTPPAIFKESQKSIKKLHPDWEYKLWTDKDIKDLKLYNKSYYKLSKNYGERADIVRYEILYKFGGVYADVDFVCLKPFDILNHTYDFYTSLMPLDCEDILCNGIIASIPSHPILKNCIESIEDDWDGSDEITVRVGPFHFQKSFWRVASKLKGRHIAFPKSYFFPINYNDKKMCKKRPEMVAQFIKPEAFAIHYWSHSWCKADIK